MEHIRPASAADASRIAEIIITNYRVNFYQFFKNDEFYFGELNVVDMAAEYREGSRGLKNTYVYDDGAVKGIIRLNGSEVEKLYVEPQFQSAGIGAKLLRFAVENKNADNLWVLEYNKRGMQFYKRHGFVLTGEKKIEDEFVPLLKMSLSAGTEDVRPKALQPDDLNAPGCASLSAIDIINQRHSYRGKYSPEPVPRDDLATIMKAGLAAPSGCNKQTTSLIAVDDKEVLDRLHAVIDPPVGETAPAMICVLTRRINAYRDRCFAVQDYSAAIENMLLAIEELGYKSCWYEGHITDEDRIGRKMADILGVPDEYELVCILPVGKAVGTPEPPKKLAFEERAWFNGFPEKRR